MALNGTSFNIDEAVLPQTFVLNRSRQPKIRTTRTVVRIIVVRINVRARPKNPTGYTFVPVFVTDDDLVLDPSTCDVIGNISGAVCNLNPTFVSRHERGTAKVRILEVNFNLRAVDFDEINLEYLDHVYENSGTVAATIDCYGPVTRKRVAKGYKVPVSSPVSPSKKGRTQTDIEEGLVDTPSEADSELTEVTDV